MSRSYKKQNAARNGGICGRSFRLIFTCFGQQLYELCRGIDGNWRFAVILCVPRHDAVHAGAHRRLDHHGILKSQPFAVSKAVETPDEVLIETRCYSNAASDAIYRDFPHAFKCKITYRLSAEGLEQEVMFGNKSDLPMPVGVGFHTPLNVPFAGGDAADYRLRMAVGERFELNGRNLPTGRLLPLDERFARLRAPEGLQATGCEAIEAGFSVREIEVDGRPFRGAVVENRRTGVRVFYEVDSQTLYWTLWNNGGQVPYCCPEPQSGATDAPNLPDRERWGFRSIPPGGKWSIRYRLYVK